MVEILEVRTENPSTKTFVLDKRMDAKAGQFVMLWLPGVGEKPMALSKLDGDIEITVKERGPFTKKFCRLEKGSLVGIRGPYGDGYFRIDGKRPCIVAGGMGIVPLIYLVEKFGEKATLILGAKTKEELLFLDRIKKSGVNLRVSTDDGSLGEKCLCSELFDREVEGKKFDQIYCCGPEPMMKIIAKIAVKKGILCQLSLERWIKCGIGICGSCALDPLGLLVCKDGPVFQADQLTGTEFGHYRRSASGGRIDL